MNSYVHRSVIAMAAVLIVACGKEPTSEPVTPAPEPAPEVAAPPPTEPVPAPSPSAGQQEVTAPAGTDGVTGFHGFGPARFGDDEQSMRIAWGRPLSFDHAPSADAPCAYLMPDPAPSNELRIAFMFDNGRFVRYDVKGEGYEAPGGGRVGNNAEAIKTLYASRYVQQPHKYVEGGKNVIVEAPEGGDSKLIFELDGSGTVTAWRVGVPPNVDFVEGCS